MPCAGWPSAGKDEAEEGFMDNHDDFVDGERSMRQGQMQQQMQQQMQNPYMMTSGMGMPGQFNGYGSIGGMPTGQMSGAPGVMGWQGGRPDQAGFRPQAAPPGSRPGAPAQVPAHSHQLHCVCARRQVARGAVSCMPNVQRPLCASVAP